MTRTNHILALADELGVRVDWAPHFKYSEAYSERIVVGEDLEQEDAYWAALHELGHVAMGHHRLPDLLTGRLEVEAEAWAYAFEKAKEEPSREARGAIAGALSSYLASHWKWHLYGEPGPTFKRVLGEVTFPMFD